MPLVRTAIRAALATAIVAGPAAAAGIGDMSAEERETFREEVRAYLMDNPEVLMEAIAVLEDRQAESAAATDERLVAAHRDALMDESTSWVGGNPDGDITVVEFMDYRCGYCRRAHPEVTELIRSDGNIRYIVKEFPILGEPSLLASRFAVATRQVAGDEAYRTIHDALMSFDGEITENSVAALAEEASLDPAPILDAMDDPEVERIISETRALGQAMGISGTPSFVFGDQMVRGYVPLDAMRELVEQERG